MDHRASTRRQLDELSKQLVARISKQLVARKLPRPKARALVETMLNYQFDDVRRFQVEILVELLVERLAAAKALVGAEAFDAFVEQQRELFVAHVFANLVELPAQHVVDELLAGASQKLTRGWAEQLAAQLDLVVDQKPPRQYLDDFLARN